MRLPQHDPRVGALQQAIHSGDLEVLRPPLDEHPGLAGARIGDAKGSATPLHKAADWPGFFPEGGRVVAMLIAAGADPNVPTEGGGRPETPLHYAASTDDAEVAKALMDGGVDIEIRHGSIADGTALTNAVGYGCWQVAALVLWHGAKVESLWGGDQRGLLPGLPRRPAPGGGLPVGAGGRSERVARLCPRADPPGRGRGNVHPVGHPCLLAQGEGGQSGVVAATFRVTTAALSRPGCRCGARRRPGDGAGHRMAGLRALIALLQARGARSSHV